MLTHQDLIALQTAEQPLRRAERQLESRQEVRFDSQPELLPESRREQRLGAGALARWLHRNPGRSPARARTAAGGRRTGTLAACAAVEGPAR